MKNISSLLKLYATLMICAIIFIPCYAVQNGIFKVKEVSTKKYHSEIKSWDDWTKFTPLDNEISNVRFEDGKILVSVSNLGESYQFEVSEVKFQRNTTSNWNIYEGLAKREGRTLGKVQFHFPDDQRIEDYNRGSLDNPFLTMYLEFIAFNGEYNLDKIHPMPELNQIAVCLKLNR